MTEKFDLAYEIERASARWWETEKERKRAEEAERIEKAEANDVRVRTMMSAVLGPDLVDALNMHAVGTLSYKAQFEYGGVHFEIWKPDKTRGWSICSRRSPNTTYDDMQTSVRDADLREFLLAYIGRCALMVPVKSEGK